MMYFRLKLIVILLLFELTSILCTRDTHSDHNASKKKNPIQLSADINNNLFLQSLQSTTLSSTKENSENLPIIKPNLFLTQEKRTTRLPFFSNNNPFLHTGSEMENNIGYHTTSLPSYTTASTPSTFDKPFEIGSLISSGSQTTISELKCEEYVREIADTIERTLLIEQLPDAIKMANPCPNVNRLVTNGVNVTSGELPHMVALGKHNSDGTFMLMCGATLISHNWILSAAHCTHGPNGAPLHARMGFDKLTDQQSGIIIAIKNMMRHPDYHPPAMYADIALMELQTSVTFNTFIRPACLYQHYDKVPEKALVSGWGATEFAGETNDNLQKAELILIENLRCAIQHNTSREVPYGVTPSMICAGGNDDRDSCQGDSGSPLQIRKNMCIFQVIGITSFGRGCAIMNLPGVYTRVSHYISWIENIVWPQ